tara:strand:+ start:335 stop:976 length:642 start_codon:yes stop_codon:yes gene_type:complete
MIIKNSQQDIKINIPADVSNVGIKLSGGADSAILCYILAKYKQEYRPDINIKPITCINDIKPFNLKYARKILNKISELTNIEFPETEHKITKIRYSHYIEDQTIFLNLLYKIKAIQIHFVGITANPPIYLGPKGPGDDRSKINNQIIIKKTSYRPLINIDKKGVCELYNTLEVLDDLFPETFSCESLDNKEYKIHCEGCWFCKERYWGFNRYV